MSTRSALLALILALVLVSPAQAETRYPGQRALSEVPEIVTMMTAADAYWNDRGVPGCVPQIDIADSLADTDTLTAVGRGWSPNTHGECRIALDHQYVGRMIGKSRRPYRMVTRGQRAQLQREPLAYLYTLILHEFGHVRELPHTTTGVMAPRLDVFPYEARVLARQLRPRSQAQRNQHNP